MFISVSIHSFVPLSPAPWFFSYGAILMLRFGCHRCSMMRDSQYACFHSTNFFIISFIYFDSFSDDSSIESLHTVNYLLRKPAWSSKPLSIRQWVGVFGMFPEFAKVFTHPLLNVTDTFAFFYSYSVISIFYGVVSRGITVTLPLWYSVYHGRLPNFPIFSSPLQTPFCLNCPHDWGIFSFQSSLSSIQSEIHVRVMLCNFQL